MTKCDDDCVEGDDVVGDDGDEDGRLLLRRWLRGCDDEDGDAGGEPTGVHAADRNLALLRFPAWRGRGRSARRRRTAGGRGSCGSRTPANFSRLSRRISLGRGGVGLC